MIDNQLDEQVAQILEHARCQICQVTWVSHEGYEG
jgi:hypothetical protein